MKKQFKMGFSSKFSCDSALRRPSQLLQMRLGEAEVASAQHGTSTYFSHIQVASCLSSSFPFFPSRICSLVV